MARVRPLLLALAVSATVAGGWRTAGALAPPHVADEELARSPIVVVARWDPLGKTERHDDVEGNVVRHAETRTEVVVERVIAGDLAPGRNTMLLPWGIAWAEDGRIRTGTSTDLYGDVEDVRKPALWFFRKAKSWDAKETREFLQPDAAHRSAQPLALEPYFLALRGPEPEAAVLRCLPTEDPVVALRILEYAAGGKFPPPYWSEFDAWHRGERDPKAARPALTGGVRALLAFPDPDVRGHATAVFAELSGEPGTAALRSLIADPDAGVRAVAIGALAVRRDEASIGGIVAAAGGIDAPSLAGDMVDRLRAWGDARLVPALIALLGQDAGPDEGVGAARLPAVLARDALKDLTGYAFPYDPEASLDAWNDAASRPDRSARVARLRELLGDDADPLFLRLPAPTEGGGLPSRAEVVNRSRRDVWIQRQPTRWSAHDAGWWEDWSGSPVKGKEDFVRIAPGGAYSIETSHPGRAGDPRTWTRLEFTRTGREFGVQAWVGVLEGPPVERETPATGK